MFCHRFTRQATLYKTKPEGISLKCSASWPTDILALSDLCGQQIYIHLSVAYDLPP